MTWKNEAPGTTSAHLTDPSTVYHWCPEMVGSRPWACAGPGRTTTKLGRDPLRRSFVVISGVLIDDSYDELLKY